MKVCAVRTPGGADQLVIEERSRPEPREGEVLVKVMAAGIGLADVMMRSGAYPGVDTAGLVPGLEVAGIIEATGPGVASDRVGQRVYGLCGKGGGYAEAVVLDESAAMPLPDSVSFTAAVGTGLNAIVAHACLRRAAMKAGDAVLVRGAGGGIGSMAVQLVAADGATCTAATSKEELARSLGARVVVDRSGGDGPYDIVIDPVGGTDAGTFFAKLKPNGRIVVCGVAGGLPPSDFAAGMLGAFFLSPTVSALSLNSLPAEEIGNAARAVFGMVADGRLRAVIDREVGFPGVSDAHRSLESGTVCGKVILVPHGS